MTGSVILDPLVPGWALALLGTVATAGILLAIWRGLSGWALRALGTLVLIAALAGPVLQRETREALSDIVILMVDKSASQTLPGRTERTDAAAEAISQRLLARPGTEVRRVEVGDGEDNSGTRLFSALADALAEEPRGRVAGIVALSDGQVHDLDSAPDLPAPMHLLLTGQDTDWDRRLVVANAPAFAIVGEPVTLTLRAEDMGAVPDSAGTSTPIEISVDGGDAQTLRLPLGRDIEVPVTLPHGGRNVIRFSVPMAAGELTDRNNAALVQINGVRDRLRVLLVSGEPHPGTRTWRNLLKSDSSVDLVHFTILRPPEKQDGVPVAELSLIAFPTRELFLEKVDDFDLIIFDRYKRRGILPSAYLENVAEYVVKGGAVLVSAGPDFASAESLYRSPLSRVLPAEPTARVIEDPFRPAISEIGARHPVTAGLPAPESWGRWLRQADVTPRDGDVLMTGHEERPLLVLDRVGEGRVALLASDHAWLWDRGYEGGGPQLELLRRLAHWMMGEPDLEEEALVAEATGNDIRITRRTLAPEVGAITVTRPDGSTTELPLDEAAPGRFEGLFSASEMGLYRLSDGETNSVIGVGPAAPREFEATIASGDALAPVLASVRGGTLSVDDGLPVFRDIRPGRPAAGRGWIGLTPRDSFETTDVTRSALLPPWLALLLIAGLVVAGWLREGRR